MKEEEEKDYKRKEERWNDSEEVEKEELEEYEKDYEGEKKNEKDKEELILSVFYELWIILFYFD